MRWHDKTILIGSLLVFCCSAWAAGQVAIHGDRVYTMAGEPLRDATILIKDGKIAAIGRSAEIKIPEDFETLSAAVVTPGLIDAHGTVGLSGLLNTKHDQDQLEHNAPLQPELRAIDAYNSADELVAWIRNYGITTVHTGHAPGELISGQTLITKTSGGPVKDTLLNPACAVAVTLTHSARRSHDSSPGTRGKMISMLRTELIKAQEYAEKHREFLHRSNQSEESTESKETTDDDLPPSRDLRLESLVEVLDGKMALMVTADRAQDIASALRLAHEFDLKLWLDGGAESYLLIDEIKASGVPVLIHPTMERATGERENLSFETAATLVDAGIPVAFQSGFTAYVPKTRVVLFEAGMAAANGLTFDQALAAITIESAKILNIDKRVGSLEIGKDGDVALYDGDPFEYTTHCTAVVIDGVVHSRSAH